MSLFLSPARYFYILYSYLVSDQRWLTIRLHYLNHTPSDYDPPSFIRVSEKSPALKFHENETKEVEKLDVGGLNAGFHASVLLSLSRLNHLPHLPLMIFTAEFPSRYQVRTRPIVKNVQDVAVAQDLFMQTWTLMRSNSLQTSPSHP